MSIQEVRLSGNSIFANGEIGIVWGDDHESIYAGHPLRCACACANCVDELSGAKILRDETVPLDIQATEIHEVGNYGLSVLWSDGHDTGIYSWEYLHHLCVDRQSLWQDYLNRLSEAGASRDPDVQVLRLGD